MDGGVGGVGMRWMRVGEGESERGLGWGWVWGRNLVRR